MFPHKGRLADRDGRGRDLRPDPPVVASGRDTRDRPARRQLRKPARRPERPVDRLEARPATRLCRAAAAAAIRVSQ